MKIKAILEAWPLLFVLVLMVLALLMCPVYF